MGKDPFTNYQNLLNKVDDFSSRVSQTYREYLVCRRGCTDCCQRDVYLLPVEFYFMHRRFLRLPVALRKVIRTEALNRNEQDLSCPRLHKGGCLLYDRRPVICRTHGLPLLIRGECEERRDCCPKSFVGHSLEHLPGSDLLDLERLNTILVAVNMVFASHVGVEAGLRLPLSLLATYNKFHTF